MHTTVDEQAAVTDPRVTEHERRFEFYRALSRAYDYDGLPLPEMVVFFEDGVDLKMDDNQPGDVDRWAAHLGLTCTTGKSVIGRFGERLWRSYRAGHAGEHRWHNYRVTVKSYVDLTDDEAAAYLAQQAEGS